LVEFTLDEFLEDYLVYAPPFLLLGHQAGDARLGQFG
jgi:hypothetical protein